MVILFIFKFWYFISDKISIFFNMWCLILMIKASNYIIGIFEENLKDCKEYLTVLFFYRFFRIKLLAYPALVLRRLFSELYVLEIHI
jgi:hypothetical protein